MARSVRRRVLLGIRIVLIPALLVIMYRDYRHEGVVGVVGDLAMYGVIAGFSYSNFQGKKLAEENIRKAGLTTDRD
jgi:hypothetical protein